MIEVFQKPDITELKRAVLGLVGPVSHEHACAVFKQT